MAAGYIEPLHAGADQRCYIDGVWKHSTVNKNRQRGDDGVFGDQSTNIACTMWVRLHEGCQVPAPTML
jgi:hypothetical protein